MKSLSTTEFNLVVRVKSGDASANVELWERYKPVAVSLLKSVPGMVLEEKISEAYMVFLHKIELFDPKKVLAVRNPESFTFSYMFVGGIKNLKELLTARWLKEMANIAYDAFDDTTDDGVDKIYSCLVVKKYDFSPQKANREKVSERYFNQYNPENSIFQLSEKDLNMKVQLLYNKISDFQKDILRLRRENKTFFEISQILDCSLTTVKRHYKIAKVIGERILKKGEGENDIKRLQR